MAVSHGQGERVIPYGGVVDDAVERAARPGQGAQVNAVACALVLALWIAAVVYAVWASV